MWNKPTAKYKSYYQKPQSSKVARDKNLEIGIKGFVLSVVSGLNHVVIYMMATGDLYGH
jgi:hypothetical protein